jgi:hypothetical protein
MHTKQEAGLLDQRLVALFGAGWLVFSFPVLKLWLGDAGPHAVAAHSGPAAVHTVAGLPLLPAALFACWALLIAGLAVLMETTPEPDAPAPATPQP